MVIVLLLIIYFYMLLVRFISFYGFGLCFSEEIGVLVLLFVVVVGGM